MNSTAIKTTHISIPAPGFGVDYTPIALADLLVAHPDAQVISVRATSSADVRNPTTGRDERILEVEVKWTAA